MKCLPFGNDAPGKKLASIVAALSRGAKEIDAPLRSAVRVFHVHRYKWYAHLGGPNVMFRVDVSSVLKTGIPGGIVEGIFGLVDFQVDPLIVGSHLKLKIMIHTLGLRIQENFDDVTIPKLPSLRLQIFPFINIQGIVSTRKRKVDILFRPERCDTSCRFRIMGLARSIVVKLNPFRLLPGRFGEIAIRKEVRGRMLGFSLYPAGVGLFRPAGGLAYRNSSDSRKHHCACKEAKANFENKHPATPAALSHFDNGK